MLSLSFPAVGLSLALLVITAVSTAACAQAPAEVRGTWMTTTANDAIASPTKTNASMKQLRDIGLNTVYVETWKNGYTQFPSPTLEATLGVERRPDLLPGHPNYPANTPGLTGPRDLLEETLIAAHRNQMIYIAWFEYGFMASYKDTNNTLRQKKPEWMMTTKDGELVSDQNPFVWMNPLRPECREFLLGIVLDAVDRYDLDGVQLDDRIAWPVTMGYDEFTVEAYKKEHRGKAPPSDPRDEAWIAWRAKKVGEFAEQFYTELKKARPNLIVSISPAVYPWSLENYACDWRTWSKNGWMDEYIPQVYRMNYQRVSEDWPVQLKAVGRDRYDDLIGGFRVVGEGPDTTWEDYARKLELVRRRGGGGHCHWFSRGVLEVYPEEFTAFYDVLNQGQAQNPLLPQDWRPAPIVATHHSDTSAWTANVEGAPGHYRVIVRRGDVWTELRVIETEPGVDVIEFNDLPAEVEAVELLIDRRQTEPLGS
ncbi:MAG: family 10 glycosylhydrolase [Planctomycetota bacterium]